MLCCDAAPPLMGYALYLPPCAQRLFDAAVRHTRYCHEMRRCQPPRLSYACAEYGAERRYVTPCRLGYAIAKTLLPMMPLLSQQRYTLCRLYYCRYDYIGVVAAPPQQISAYCSYARCASCRAATISVYVAEALRRCCQRRDATI